MVTTIEMAHLRLCRVSSTWEASTWIISMNFVSDLDVLFKQNSLSVTSGGSDGLLQTSTCFLKGITYTGILFPKASQCFWTKGYFYVCIMCAYIYIYIHVYIYICVCVIYCYIGVGSSEIKSAYNEDTTATLTPCSWRLLEFVSLSTCPGSVWDRVHFLPSRRYNDVFWIQCKHNVDSTDTLLLSSACFKSKTFHCLMLC